MDNLMHTLTMVCSLFAMFIALFAWSKVHQALTVSRKVAMNLVRLGEATGDTVDELTVAVRALDKALNVLRHENDTDGLATPREDIRQLVKEAARDHAGGANAGES